MLLFQHHLRVGEFLKYILDLKQARVVYCTYFASGRKNEGCVLSGGKTPDLWVSSSSCQWEKCVCFSMT